MELKLLSKGKHGGNTWVYEAHPATPDKKTITHISENIIENKGIYGRVEEVNNTVATYAHTFGLDVCEAYAEFFTLGFRVSQQLKGRVIDFTIPKYWKAEQYLGEALKKGIVRHYAVESSNELEKLVSPELLQGVPKEDQTTIIDYVDRLQRLSFPVDSTGDILYSLPKEAERRVKGTFEVMIDNLVADLKRRVSPTAERYAQVKPEARAEFLALSRYGDLFGQAPYGNWFERNMDQEDLIGMVSEVDGVAARNLFRAFRKEITREDGAFNDLIKMVKDYLNPKSSMHLAIDKQPLFFELLVEAQNTKVLSDLRESIPADAAWLLGVYSKEEVKDIASQAFAIAEDGKNPGDFFKKKAEERKKS